MSADIQEKVQGVFDSLARDFSKLRSGRVSVSVLDDIRVESYGDLAPLNQVATVSNPESRLIVISPWDKSMLSVIEKAIQKANIGVNPSNDGKVIRLAFPAMSQEGRDANVKQAKEIAEKHKVSLRNIRRDAIDALKKSEKAGDISEDELKSSTAEIDDKCSSAVDKITKELDKKIAEIKTI